MKTFFPIPKETDTEIKFTGLDGVERTFRRVLPTGHGPRANMYAKTDVRRTWNWAKFKGGF